MQKKKILMTMAALSLFIWGAAVIAQELSDPKIEKDIVYGKTADDEELKLDMAHPPSGEGPFPLIIFLHGGGWRMGDRSEYHEGLRGFAKLGWVGATIQYRFAPKYKFPAQIDDVRMALAFLRANAKKYNLDPNRIGVVGGSAGGHLSLLLGLSKDKDGKPAPGVRAVVNMSGPADFRTWRIGEDGEKALRGATGRDLNGMIEDFLGTSDRKSRVIAEVSPITHVRKGNPAAVLTLHGSADPLAPVQHSKDLHQALKQAGVTEKLVVLEGEGHGFEGEQKVKAILEMVDFLDRYVKKAP